MAAIPVPAEVTTSSGSLGGIPVVNVAAPGTLGYRNQPGRC